MMIANEVLCSRSIDSRSLLALHVQAASRSRLYVVKFVCVFQLYVFCGFFFCFAIGLVGSGETLVFLLLLLLLLKD
ncbi:unnamed protein product [Camellia sinensis]